MRLQNNISAVLCFISVFQTCFGANILFFFTGGTYSHDIAIWPLAVRLAERNHSITFFSAHSKKPWKDSRIRIINPIQIQEVNSKYLGDTLKQRLSSQEKIFWHIILPPWSYDICEYILTNPEKPETRAVFYETKFDLVILDAALCDCGYIVGHFHNAKVIVSDSTSVLPWFHHVLGFPTEFTWVPATSTFFQYPMRIWDMIENYFEVLYITYIRRTELYPKLELLAKNLITDKDIPSFLEMERNVDLVFVNTHPSVELPRSLPPNVIPVGGLQMFGQKNATIPKSIERYIDEAEDGVILLAFGSSVDFSSLPSKIESAFFNAFQRFPRITFIAKATGKRQANCPDNLKYEAWIPQKEVLAHPKTLACITHGGLNGIIEATWTGQPLITVPIFAEQDHQSYKLQARGVGIRLEMRDITADIMSEAIVNITTDSKYRENMKKLQAAFKDRPASPLDLAAYWTEFVLRHEDLSFMKPVTYQPWNVYFQNLFFSMGAIVTAGGITLTVLTLSIYAFNRNK